MSEIKVRNISEEISKCKDCNDNEYFSKYMHYLYLDDKDPLQSCARHWDKSRKWVCITTPRWVDNLYEE